MQDMLSELDGCYQQMWWYLYALVGIDVFRTFEHLDVDINRIPERIARCPQGPGNTHLSSFTCSQSLRPKILVESDCEFIAIHVHSSLCLILCS